MLGAFVTFITMATACDSMGVIWISVTTGIVNRGGMDTTGSRGACLATYRSPTLIISAPAAETDEIILAAAPICEETAPNNATTLKTAAVSLTTFAMLVISFNIDLTCHGNHCPTLTRIFNVTPQYFQPMQPLPVPIVAKSNMLTHPERRILRVKRPSLRQKSAMYEKDEVDELSERMEYLNIGSNTENH